jgi:hypothetical protein
MKAKLIRYNGSFYLIDENTKITSHHHLSKQNCDEIFGVVDVEKLAEECSIDWNGEVMEGSCGIYKDGFNKAMELNKDKVFTLEDMIRISEFVKIIAQSEPHITAKELVSSYVQPLQQPTEIEVEIVMEEVQEIYRDGTVKWERCPKLDLEGRLVLTKKI